MITRVLKVLLVLDAIVIVFCLAMGNTIWLLNTQIAFFSSLIVTLGSYMGYRKNIDKRVENHSSYDDGYDELDQMDDRHDLYSPEVPEEVVQEEMTKEQIKEEIEKSKKSLKKNYIRNFIGGFSGMASIYRLAGYVVLIIGFFYLNNNGYLHILSYIFGFVLVPICALVLQFTLKNESLEQ